MSSGFKILVSPDKMPATLAIQAGVGSLLLEVLAALRELKLAKFDQAAVARTLDARDKRAVSVVVATGVAPVDGQSPAVRYRVPVADGKGKPVAKVEANQVLAVLGGDEPGT